MNKKSPVSLYTDGSCIGNPGKGGYAAIIKKGNFYREIVGKVPYSTNNKMELIAITQGLSQVKSGSKVTVFTDAAYVERAVNEGRLETWKKNGWLRIRTGEPVANRDLWLVLCDTISRKKLTVKFEKIAAHKGNRYNERADFLARRAAKAK